MVNIKPWPMGHAEGARPKYLWVFQYITLPEVFNRDERLRLGTVYYYFGRTAAARIEMHHQTFNVDCLTIDLESGNFVEDSCAGDWFRLLGLYLTNKEEFRGDA